jgi:ABC-type amino acid transport substrate-binding protein
MRTKIQFIILSLIALLFATFTINYFSKKPSVSIEHENKKILRLAVSADNPPFTFYKNEIFQGFEIELIKELGSRMNYNLEILDLDFGGLIPAVKNNVVDFSISSFNITPERLKSISFSQPYYESIPTIIGYQKYKDLNQLSNKIIGVQHGSIWEIVAKKLAAENQTITVLGFHRINQIAQELSQKSIDAILIDAQVAKKICATRPMWLSEELNIPNENNNYGIVFRHDSPLIKEFNDKIFEIKNDGTLNKLVEKWFNTIELDNK